MEGEPLGGHGLYGSPLQGRKGCLWGLLPFPLRAGPVGYREQGPQPPSIAGLLGLIGHSPCTAALCRSNCVAVGANNIAFGNFQLDCSKTSAITNRFGYGLALDLRITVAKFQSYPITVSTVGALRTLQN